MIENQIKNAIRDVVDFPKPGIVFKDITPIMMNPVLSQQILDHLVDTYKDQKLYKIALIQIRCFYCVIMLAGFGYFCNCKSCIIFVD